MENFEETVVNPNIHLKDINGQLQQASEKQSEVKGLIRKQGSRKKLINGYFLFAATIIILLIAIVARV